MSEASSQWKHEDLLSVYERIQTGNPRRMQGIYVDAGFHREMFDIDSAIETETRDLPTMPYLDRTPKSALEIRENTPFIVSYPRSGNTWSRFLIAGLFTPDGRTDFDHMIQTIPDIHTTKPDEIPDDFLAVKSHKPASSGYSNVIYIVRDPRNVFPSYYEFANLQETKFSETLEQYLEKAFSLNCWPCPWDLHVEGWLAAACHADIRFLLVRYEDLIADTKRQLRRIALFLGLDFSDVVLDRVIDYSSRARMGALKLRSDRSLNHKISDRNKVGLTNRDYGQCMNDDLIRSIEKKFGRTMKKLGYALKFEESTPPPESRRAFPKSFTLAVDTQAEIRHYVDDIATALVAEIFDLRSEISELRKRLGE